ncbi:MAG: hypothetical protein MPJ24_09895 [Pirellulaceae bacterium]|nr:hypothetical protein [Pirellulaceae bacterium]
MAQKGENLAKKKIKKKLRNKQKRGFAEGKVKKNAKGDAAALAAAVIVCDTLYNTYKALKETPGCKEHHSCKKLYEITLKRITLATSRSGYVALDCDQVFYDAGKFRPKMKKDTNRRMTLAEQKKGHEQQENSIGKAALKCLKLMRRKKCPQLKAVEDFRAKQDYEIYGS